ncbi:hypothetical protein W97_06880 [Coniosporium apollinis CBS 100218]|uniref:Short-chain dehydrogenase/reductase 3 n=1 Tax=Coniosporium apollinis (strain CBS 100218) TaxID=1168221 RepID=R7Z036_CONA1|nr:uncharacterized protein W97_06880 [Coniosporium apollinis CBS 100218]EON67512.1 hypothetical protein W97_06880 [Coniosporium apollinis CBS 100218]
MSAPTRRTTERPWHQHLTIDLLAYVLNRSIFHPFIAWLIPLSLRAKVTPYDAPSMILAIAWAVLITVYTILSYIDRRIAYGLPRDVDLEEEVIVITGGASGLGALIAEVYGLRGASVAVLDVKEPEGEVNGVEFYKCDVGDRAQVERAARQIERDLGTPTILINNAGIMHGKPLLQLTPTEISQTMHVNLLSHFHTLQTFLPGMLSEGRGTIVTVSSVLAHIGAANLSDYTASKAALLALHASLAAELAQHPDPAARDIKMILVAPGQLGTSMFEKVRTPSAFLAPVVEPNELAKEIIRMVDAGESGEISMPLYARWIWLWGRLPVGVRKLVRTAGGIDTAMAPLSKEGKKER